MSKIEKKTLNVNSGCLNYRPENLIYNYKDCCLQLLVCLKNFSWALNFVKFYATDLTTRPQLSWIDVFNCENCAQQFKPMELCFVVSTNRLLVQ